MQPLSKRRSRVLMARCRPTQTEEDEEREWDSLRGLQGPESEFDSEG